MDISKNNLKIGKVRIDISKSIPYGQKKESENEVVVLKPDPDQSEESKSVARKFLSNVFPKEDKYGSGIISFDLNDPEGWKAKYGNKFIKAITSSGSKISWTGNPKALKGLNALLPTGFQLNIGSSLGPSTPSFGGSLGGSFDFKPSSSFSGSSFSNSQIGNLDSIINPSAVSPNIAPEATPGAPEVQKSHYFINDTIRLLKLWEEHKDEV